MDFKAKLSERIGIEDVREVVCLALQSEERRRELYDLVLGGDDTAGYHAAWVFTHFPSKDSEWLYDKQDELIAEVLSCRHGGKRRVLLNLLCKQPFASPPRVDFLDFCLERMMSIQELPGVRMLCMKIACKLCSPIPELVQELKNALEVMENEESPAIRIVRKNILKAMRKGKSLPGEY